MLQKIVFPTFSNETNSLKGHSTEQTFAKHFSYKPCNSTSVLAAYFFGRYLASLAAVKFQVI